jgi:hypothetical protein
MKAPDRRQPEISASECSRFAFFAGRRGMLKLALAVICALLPLLSGCASLLDGKFVGREGKESSFKPIHNPYEFPRDPTARQ